MIISNKQLQKLNAFMEYNFIRQLVLELSTDRSTELVNEYNFKKWISDSRSFGFIYSQDIKDYLKLCCEIPDLRQDSKSELLLFYLTHPDLKPQEKLSIISETFILVSENGN